MENQQTPSGSGSLGNFFNISFDEATRGQIRKAAQWVRIAALCTFIGYGISLIVLFFGKTGSVETEEGLRVSSAYPGQHYLRLPVSDWTGCVDLLFPVSLCHIGSQRNGRDGQHQDQ